MVSSYRIQLPFRLTYMHRTATSNHQIPGEYYFLITTVLPHHTCVIFIIEYVVQFNYILVNLNDCKSKQAIKGYHGYLPVCVCVCNKYLNTYYHRVISMVCIIIHIHLCVIEFICIAVVKPLY